MSGQVRVEACPGLPTVCGARREASSFFTAQKKSTSGGGQDKTPLQGCRAPMVPFSLPCGQGWGEERCRASENLCKADRICGLPC